MGEGDPELGSWPKGKACCAIVCAITQGITLDTVRPLGVCVCVVGVGGRGRGWGWVVGGGVARLCYCLLSSGITLPFRRRGCPISCEHENPC